MVKRTPGKNRQVCTRTMEAGEFNAMREVSVGAFGGDEQIGRLLDALHDSWAWDDDLSFVAERGDEIVGQVLYTHAILDAPRRLQDVLVLSPIGVHPDLQGRGSALNSSRPASRCLPDGTNRSSFWRDTRPITRVSGSVVRSTWASRHRRSVSPRMPSWCIHSRVTSPG